MEEQPPERPLPQWEDLVLGVAVVLWEARRLVPNVSGVLPEKEDVHVRPFERLVNETGTGSQEELPLSCGLYVLLGVEVIGGFERLQHPLYVYLQENMNILKYIVLLTFSAWVHQAH